MKVDRNQAVGGVPLRRQIAANLMASEHGRDVQVASCDVQRHAMHFLTWADALIAAHNATCEETLQ